MKKTIVFLAVVLLTLAARAQENPTFTTSGGLTVVVPDGFLVVEQGPTAVAFVNREAHDHRVVLKVMESAADPADLLAVELRRLGAMDVQQGALEIRTENAHAVMARVTRAEDTAMTGYVLFGAGRVGLLTVLPADRAPRLFLRDLLAGVRFARGADVDYPLCGSAELPLTITTSGGLSLCFPEGYEAEEKGPNSVGLAHLDDGVVISVHARQDLNALAGMLPEDAASAVARFVDLLAASGERPVWDSEETLVFDSGDGAAMRLLYPDIGEGRVLAVQTPDGVVAISSVIVGDIPADIDATLRAILNSAVLGMPNGRTGESAPADTRVRVGGLTVKVLPDWTLVSEAGDTLTLQRPADGVLLNVSAASLDAGWNSQAYQANILPVAAQFAGDVAFSSESVTAYGEAQDILVYDSAVSVPEGENPVSISVLLTVRDEIFAVFQASVPRTAYSVALREEIVNMAADAAS